MARIKKIVDIRDRLKSIAKEQTGLQKELKIMRGILKISKTKDVSKLIVGKILVKRGLVSVTTGKITQQGKVALKRLS